MKAPTTTHIFARASCSWFNINISTSMRLKCSMIGVGVDIGVGVGDDIGGHNNNID